MSNWDAELDGYCFPVQLVITYMKQFDFDNLLIFTSETNLQETLIPEFPRWVPRCVNMVS